MQIEHTKDLKWVIQLPRNASAAILSLRLFPGIEVGEDASGIWLRGESASEVLLPHLKVLPAGRRYVWLADGRLRPCESRLVTLTLPSLTWQPIHAWAAVTLPPARLPASLPIRSQLHLVVSNEVVPINGLRLTFDDWFTWAIDAAAARLAPLVYATSSDGSTLVLGLPLPSARGVHLVENEGVMIPAGFTSSPKVSMAVVRRVLGASENDLVYWDLAGARLLNRDLFVGASRSSLRATRDALKTASVHAD